MTAEGFESDEELLGMLASLVEVDPVRFGEAVESVPSFPTATTLPVGSPAPLRWTVPGGCGEPASPRATLEARVAGEFPGDAVTVLSDTSTGS